MNKKWQIAALAVVIVILAAGSYYWWQKSAKNTNQACTAEAKLCDDGSAVGRTGPNCEFTQCPNEATANWRTYESAALGLSFKYPKEYESPRESENYLSLMSPLNPDREKKQLEAQNGELKIEIVIESGRENDSVQKCWNDHSSGEGKILKQSEITISDIKTEVLTWEGLGTGQFMCVNFGDKRYLINKYPAETTRQNEYGRIISTFKFIK